MSDNRRRRQKQYERLTHPLVRDANGTLRQARWDEALERAAGGFRRTRDAYGPDAFAMLVCPTGALSFKTEFDMRAAGTWDEPARTETTTVCAYCGVGCNVTLHVQDNEIVKVTSPHDNPVAHGNLCIKGRFGFQHVQNRV
ncbi:molybdopterin-dependent oxidoreductase [Streptomyces sp. NPDC057582]|uniref:molybdopterin-dependent oxidoreductase n=1 Tax=Streptomyces sp. NPDC057582 TaxID=3346174 RepID=UPI0036C43088